MFRQLSRLYRTCESELAEPHMILVERWSFDLMNEAVIRRSQNDFVWSNLLTFFLLDSVGL